MLSMLFNCIFTTAISAIVLAKDAIFSLASSLYAANKVSLGIAIPLASI